MKHSTLDSQESLIANRCTLYKEKNKALNLKVFYFNNFIPSNRKCEKYEQNFYIFFYRVDIFYCIYTFFSHKNRIVEQLFRDNSGENRIVLKVYWTMFHIRQCALWNTVTDSKHQYVLLHNCFSLFSCAFSKMKEKKATMIYIRPSGTSWPGSSIKKFQILPW